MLEKMSKFFAEGQLECSQCGNVIKEGEKFSVTLTLPSQKKMPVGVLDKVLAKNAEEVLCHRCGNS